MHRHFFLLMILSVFCSLLLSGCGDKAPVVSEEELRVKRLADMREGMSGYLVAASILAVFAGLFVAPIFENIRLATARFLSLSADTQVIVAKCLFVFVLMTILRFTINDPNLGPVFPAVIILLAGVCYPFVVDYLPGLRQNDLMRRKAAMNQIKGFLMLILVVYILMHILTPDGIFNISLR